MALKLNTTKMLAEIDHGIGWITFNNPQRRNAISLEMWEGLGTILQFYQHDDSVRRIYTDTTVAAIPPEILFVLPDA